MKIELVITKRQGYHLELLRLARDATLPSVS